MPAALDGESASRLRERLPTLARLLDEAATTGRCDTFQTWCADVEAQLAKFAARRASTKRRREIATILRAYGEVSRLIGQLAQPAAQPSVPHLMGSLAGSVAQITNSLAGLATPGFPPR